MATDVDAQRLKGLGAAGERDKIGTAARLWYHPEDTSPYRAKPSSLGGGFAFTGQGGMCYTLRMSKSTYSDETKAAVMAALLAGQSISAVAKEYKIPKGTVASWRTRELGDVTHTIATQKQFEIGELLLKYLVANLQALEAQAQLFKSHAWLAKQNASDAAVLHGVMTDKMVRLLEAMANASGDTNPLN